MTTKEITAVTLTLEQVTAINNGMSMLSIMYEYASQVRTVKEFTEYTERHIKTLEDAGVDKYIVDHFYQLCLACLPIAEGAEKRHKELSRKRYTEWDETAYWWEE